MRDETKSGDNNLLSINVPQSISHLHDPVVTMVKIAENDHLSTQDKTALIHYVRSRFNHRRRMAYTSLYMIVGSLVIFLISGIIDGVTGQLDNGILSNFQKNSEAIIWIEGFLTSIVAAYFGVSAWRPNS